jgi:hypothetical protein
MKGYKRKTDGYLFRADAVTVFPADKFDEVELDADGNEVEKKAEKKAEKKD